MFRLSYNPIRAEQSRAEQSRAEQSRAEANCVLLSCPKINKGYNARDRSITAVMGVFVY